VRVRWMLDSHRGRRHVAEALRELRGDALQGDREPRGRRGGPSAEPRPCSSTCATSRTDRRLRELDRIVLAPDLLCLLRRRTGRRRATESREQGSASMRTVRSESSTSWVAPRRRARSASSCSTESLRLSSQRGRFRLTASVARADGGVPPAVEIGLFHDSKPAITSSRFLLGTRRRTTQAARPHPSRARR